MKVLSLAVGQANINGEKLKTYPIPIPPTLPEQARIVEALSDADALINALDQLIAKKRDIKQAAMQLLLTVQKRLPGFQGEWKVKRFGDIASLSRNRIDPSKIGTNRFCVELEQIEPQSGKLLGNIEINEPTSLKSVFEKGDVLFCKLRAYLRKFWLATCSGICSTEIWVLVPNNEVVTSHFLFQLIKTYEFINIASISYGTHMPRSDWNIVKDYEVRLPILDEQNAISKVLGEMDFEIESLEASRDKTKLLKQAMMQELLTGRIRLI